MTLQPVNPSALVERFVTLALATAIYAGEDTAEGVANWAAEVLPPDVMREVGMGELLQRAVVLLGDQDTEEVTGRARPTEALPQRTVQ